MTMNGIDVSSNNMVAGRAVSVAAVPGEFVMIKATEGLTYVNPLMATHVAQALQAGRALGFYHYLRANAPALEAAHFLQVVRPYLGRAVLAVDIEDGPLLSAKGPVNGFAFLEAVRQATGVRPLVYTNVSEERARDWARVVAGGYGLWIAQYNNYQPVTGYQPRPLPVALRHWPRYTLFQYTASGQLPGWGGVLDLNVFAGDMSTWQALAQGGARPTASPTGSAIADFQRWLNATFAAGLAVDNSAGPLTRTALVKAVQRMLNAQFGAQFGARLALDGRFGPASQAAMRAVRTGASGPLIRLIQAALLIRGYDPLGLDGQFAPGTLAAVRRFQAASGLTIDGIVGPQTARRLFDWG